MWWHTPCVMESVRKRLREKGLRRFLRDQNGAMRSEQSQGQDGWSDEALGWQRSRGEGLKDQELEESLASVTLRGSLRDSE